MITRDEAKAQVMRLSVLVGFPSVKEVLSDLVDAVETAPTIHTAKHVISDILDTCEPGSRCPLAAQIRRKISDLRPRTKRHYFEVCKGAGVLIGWYLLRYANAASFDVVSSTPLPEIKTQQDADAYAEQYGSATHQVSSAASICPACHGKAAAA